MANRHPFNSNRLIFDELWKLAEGIKANSPTATNAECLTEMLGCIPSSELRQKFLRASTSMSSPKPTEVLLEMYYQGDFP